MSEIAPGVDLQRDVLAQSRISRCGSRRDLKTMDAALFRAAPMGLELAGEALHV